MTELNGKTYDCVYLTHEEKIVVDAMRAGAEVDVWFHNQKIEDTFQKADRIPTNVFTKRRWVDQTDSENGFVRLQVQTDNVDIHFINRTTKKATDRRQA